MITKLRYYLIKLLAGESSVAVNCLIIGDISVVKGGLIHECSITGDAYER